MWGVQLNDIVRPNHCVCGLGEHGGMAVNFGAFDRSGLVAAVRKFAGVVTVVLANTEYVAVWGRNRRRQVDLGERPGLCAAAGGSADFIDMFDDIEHILGARNRRNSCFGLVDTADFNRAVHGIASKLHKSLFFQYRQHTVSMAAQAFIGVRPRADGPGSLEAGSPSG
jgi:hypothetical protein